jgi:6-phosphogluconolactonase
MKRFLLVVTLVSGALLSAAEPVYFGTYTAKGSKGIYRAEFDAETGKLSPPVLAATTKDPSFLIVSPGKSFLYAANEGSQKVSAFRIESGSGDLKLINEQDTGGDSPCHLALDVTGRMLVVANYGGGSVASFPVRTDGGVGNRASFIQFTGTGPDKKRQEAPHAHSATFTADNHFVLVDDLGTDRTMVFHVHPDTGKIEAAEPPFGTANPGAGPRHLVIDPMGHFVYVLNEMGSNVTRFAWDGTQGTLRKMDTVSALPPDFHGSTTAAEIAIDSSGRTIYTSNRGNDTIAVFRVNADGGLTLLQNISSGGKEPRNFVLDPTGGWVLAANQDSGNVVVFKIDRATGKLTRGESEIQISQAVSIVFYKK